MAAKQRFSVKLNVKINESTVRRFKTAYLEERRRKHDDGSDTEVEELNLKKRGR